MCTDEHGTGKTRHLEYSKTSNAAYITIYISSTREPIHYYVQKTNLQGAKTSAQRGLK
jgi:hypothetical protein